MGIQGVSIAKCVCCGDCILIVWIYPLNIDTFANTPVDEAYVYFESFQNNLNILHLKNNTQSRCYVI